MSLFPFNWNFGQKVQGQSKTVTPIDQSFLAHYSAAPAAVSDTAVHAAIALTAATQNVTTSITNPVTPRNVTIKGNAVGNAGNVVITGTDMSGAVITETIALNGATEVAGVKAFKTVTNIALPVEVHAGTDTVSVGIGSKLGMPHKIAFAAYLLVKLFDGSSDAGTLTIDGTDLSKNVYAYAGTANGAKVVDLTYVV